MPSKLRALVHRLAQQELDWQGRSLLAPVVAPGRARVRLQGLVYQFSVRPADFRGFGVFVPGRDGIAEFSREATLSERDRYLKLWPSHRLRLLLELQPRSWLAYPVFSQRTTEGPPLVVHEVTRGSQFELIQAAFDGAHYWYDRAVLNTRLALAEEMASCLRQGLEPAELHLSGLTPQDRSAYDCLYRAVAWEGRPEPPGGLRNRARSEDELRLERALTRGGGRLQSFASDEDNYQIHWLDSRGQEQFSSVRRHDLSVVSSGICLSGRDADFDLTSLVGVMEEQ